SLYHVLLTKLVRYKTNQIWICHAVTPSHHAMASTPDGIATPPLHPPWSAPVSGCLARRANKVFPFTRTSHEQHVIDKRLYAFPLIFPRNLAFARLLQGNTVFGNRQASFAHI